MHPLNPVVVEALVSWLGAAGVCVYLSVLLRQDCRTLLERRIVLFLACTAFLLLVRAPYWVTHSGLFGFLTFLAASTIPLTGFMCFEALLRMHMPFWSKVITASGTLVFAILSLLGMMHHNPWTQGALGAFSVLMGTVIGTIVLTRDRASLTAIENGMLDANLVAIALGIPLVLTDLLGDMGFAVPRVGTLFLMMMVYTFSRLTAKGDTKRIIFYELTLTLGLGAAIALANVFLFLPAWDIPTLLRSFSLFACLILLFMTARRAQVLRARAPESTLVSALASSDTQSVARFISSIQHLPAVAGLDFVREDQLPDYDTSCIGHLFLKREILGLSYLRKELKKLKGRQLEGAEQLIDLLERRRMTHACQISDAPITLLLVDSPQAGYETAVGVEVGLVRKMAELIEQGGSHYA